MPIHTHPLSKLTVDEKLALLRNALVPQPPSAAVTRLLPPNSDFPYTTYSRLQNPTTLWPFRHLPGLCRLLGRPFRCHAFMASFQYVLKAMERGPRFSSLFNVHEWISWTRFRQVFFSFERGGDRRAARIERWTFTVPQSLTQFLFDVASPETQDHGEFAPPSLCGRFDFFARIGAWKGA